MGQIANFLDKKCKRQFYFSDSPQQQIPSSFALHQ